MFLSLMAGIFLALIAIRLLRAQRRGLLIHRFFWIWAGFIFMATLFLVVPALLGDLSKLLGFHLPANFLILGLIVFTLWCLADVYIELSKLRLLAEKNVATIVALEALLSTPDSPSSDNSGDS